MVTPMTAEGSLDYDGAARLAAYLVDDMRNDGLAISGTTGESPTTTDAEKERLLRTVLEAVGDRATIVAGVGTNDTAHTIELARQAERAGAHGLLTVTPYYNKPPQAGLYRHFTAVADATGLPVILYDIPGRTGTPIATETLIRLAEHPRIVAVKDAKGDLGAGSEVMTVTDLAFYSGEDMLNLPWLSVGACGFVSVVGHVVGDRLHDMIDAYTSGDVNRAVAIHRSLLPVYTGIFRNQGVIMTKAALGLLGLPGGSVARPADRRDARGDRAAEHRPRGRRSQDPGDGRVSHPHPELGAPPPLSLNGLRIVPLGGLGEIGRNMTVFEYGGRLLLVDCGVLFPESDQPGVDLILPDFDYIRDRLDAVDALVLTHAHEDHIGAVPYLLRERRDIPLVGSKLTLALVASKLSEHRIEPVTAEVAEGTRQRFGSFDLEFFAVNHSIPDALAVAIRTPARAGAAHRRLQDGPVAARRPADRPRGIRAARRRGHRPADVRLHERRGARDRDQRAGDRARCSPTCSRPRRSGSSWRVSPATCTGCSRCSTPRRATAARWRSSGRSMVRNMGVARDLGYLRVPGGLMVDVREVDDLPPESGRARLHRVAGRADVRALQNGHP